MKILKAEFLKGIGKELFPTITWADSYGHVRARCYRRTSEGWKYNLGPWEPARIENDSRFLNAIRKLVNE